MTDGDAAANKGVDALEVMCLIKEDRWQLEVKMEQLLWRRHEGPEGPRYHLQLPKLIEEDDIKSFLAIFEWMTSGYKVRQLRWAFKLVP